MKKDLRLIITTECNKKCDKCCNKKYDFQNMRKITDYHNYDNIVISGGEPLLDIERLVYCISSIHKSFKDVGKTTCPLFLYTSELHPSAFTDRVFGNCTISSFFTGITYTPHTKNDLESFYILNEYLLANEPIDLSLRLYLFPDMVERLDPDTDLSIWDVKHIEWLDECPVPQNEVLGVFHKFEIDKDDLFKSTSTNVRKMDDIISAISNLYGFESYVEFLTILDTIGFERHIDMYEGVIDEDHLPKSVIEKVTGETTFDKMYECVEAGYRNIFIKDPSGFCYYKFSIKE